MDQEKPPETPICPLCLRPIPPDARQSLALQMALPNCLLSSVKAQGQPDQAVISNVAV
ncbi:MAG: hypothetical protein ACU0DP_10175 [Thalassococcus profundi]|uniref:hypothetical protein n=1 Tax=Thalassococcus profundi TaxID=2282382 RepID=UPI004058F7CB